MRQIHCTAHKVGVSVTKNIKCSDKLGNGRSAGLAGFYICVATTVNKS